MYLEFDCKTNSHDLYVNYALFMTKEGKIIKLDRDSTRYDYDEEAGELSMLWTPAYEWTGDGAVYDEINPSDLSFVRLDIEDDAPEGYEIECTKAYVNGEAVLKKEFSYDEVKAFGRDDALNLCDSMENIKGYEVFFADINGYLGYSALVYKNDHHIYYADDYELHNEWRKTDHSGLREIYKEAMGNKLFTKEELGEPLKDYDEYRRKQYFLHNYYGMQVDRVSAFMLAPSKEEEAAFRERVSELTYNPVSFSYMNDKDFIKEHIGLRAKLEVAFEKTKDSYEYQKNAFLREMYNHEYSYSSQPDYDTLSAFGNITPNNDYDLEAYFKELEFTDTQIRAYMDARTEFYKEFDRSDEDIEMEEDLSEAVINKEEIPEEELPTYRNEPIKEITKEEAR